MVKAIHGDVNQGLKLVKRNASLRNNMREPINKTMDFHDLEKQAAQPIISEINELIRKIQQKKLLISSWYGSFDLTKHPYERFNRGYGYQSLPGSINDALFPWFLYWEIVWVYLNGEFRPGQRVLDLGGSSSLFSYYLASKGFNVTTIDIQKDLVENANYVSQQMGWKLKNIIMDMRNINFNYRFDHITSICVYEHLPLYDRIEINTKIKELLVDGGGFSITFDYRNPVMMAKIDSPDDILEQFVKPSGLTIRGNIDFFDNGVNYLLQPFFNRDFLWI